MEDKAATKLPVLIFRKGNNFHKLKSALSEIELEEYGDLGN
jgi:hypothetical protein